MKDIAFVLYPGFTALDMVGPLQVLGALPAFAPDYRVVVLGESKSPVPTDTPLGVTASHTFDEVPEPYAVFVPGGAVPTITAMADEQLLGRLRSMAEHAEIIGSVCTGSPSPNSPNCVHWHPPWPPTTAPPNSTGSSICCYPA